MNRWPFRQGAALGTGILLVFMIGLVAFFNATRPETLPPGFAGEGMYVFDDNCASCHGYSAEGTPDGPALVGGAAPTALLSRRDVPCQVERGSEMMTGIAVPDQELADALAYLRELRDFNGI